MAVFKVEKCGACQYKRNVPKPKEPGACPRCGAPMKYSENWYLSYQVHGRKYLKAVGPQKRLAEDALGKIRAEIREGRHFNRITETPWPTAVEQFQSWLQVNVKPSTKISYESCLRNLEPHFSRHTLNKITPHMIEQYKAARSSQVSNSTVNRDLATIKRIFSLSLKWGLVEVDKIRTVSLLTENKARERFLSLEEIERLKKAIVMSKSPYLQLAVIISLETGLRRSGVLSLKWSEIDFKTGTITKVTKGDKEVRIPITGRLRTVLQEYKAGRKILSQYVLSDDAGGHPKNLRTSFRTALTEAKIKNLRWHDLRRTFGSHFIMATKDLVALQTLLGHSDFSVTKKHYAHLIDEHLVNAMKTFEEAVTFQSPKQKTDSTKTS